MNTEKDKILFWYEDTNILLNQKYIFEFFPTEKMNYKQQLNAITRIVVLLTVIGLIITRSGKILITSIVTLIALVILYKTQYEEVPFCLAS